MKQMQYGDYDGIIIAYSCFEMIPVSAAYIENKMNEKIQEINDEIKRIREEIPILKNRRTDLYEIKEK